MKIAVFLLACILSQLPGGSESGLVPVRIAGQTHGRIAFASGLPDFKPVSRRIVAERLFAAIPIPDTFGVVYVCCGRDSKGAQRVTLLNTRRDSTSDMGDVNVDHIAGDTLFGTKDLQLLPSHGTLFPLEIRIVLPQHELIYRWTLAKEEPSIPGGLPTPRSSPISVGKPFPDFEVGLLHGGKRNLAVTGGCISVLNWWWTRCSPCIEEMPGLNTLVSKYKGKVDFVAVTSDPVKEVRAFLATRTFSYIQTLTDTSAFAVFGTSAPRNIVLDKSGTVVFDEGGGITDTYKKIEAVIQRELSH